MRNPRDFFKPLAVEAPEPLREIPFPPSRMIHFLDFSNEKMAAKAPEIATKTGLRETQVKGHLQYGLELLRQAYGVSSKK